MADRAAITALADRLQYVDEDEARSRWSRGDVERGLKTTVTLCPHCLAYVPGLVFVRGGRVWLGRACDTHGYIEAVIENDPSWYHLATKDRHGRRFDARRLVRIPAFAGGCCGDDATSCAPDDATDQSTNKTCTVLVEVTDACNLACRVCYSDARGDRYLPFEDVIGLVDRLIARKGRVDSVQLTGGEASLHPRFWDMVAALYAREGVGKVYLPTNGLRFARDDEARRAAPFADKLMVLLQFDAVSKDANVALRDAHPDVQRRRALDALGALRVPVQLTMTVSHGVNVDEIGAVVDVGLANDHVKVVALQPVTWSGRYDLPRDPTARLTLSDIAKAVVRQANVRVAERDFVPIPCSHPNCGWITVFLRRFGLVHNVVAYTDLDKMIEDVSYKTLMSTDDIRHTLTGSAGDVFRRMAAALGGRLVRSTDMFTVAVKPFMDVWTYDQDRIASCCHHITDTRGELRSFCEYNALNRASDPWTRLPDRQGVA